MGTEQDDEKDDFIFIARGRNEFISQTNKANIAKINTMELNMLVPFAKHPFQTYEGGRLEKLADSIKEIGLQNPIVVRPIDADKFEILSGHNRVKAIRLLGWNEVDAIVKEGISDEMAEKIVIESNLNQQSFADWKYSQRIQVIKIYSKYIKDNSQQGKRNDLVYDVTCVHSEHKSYDNSKRPKTRDKISKQLGISPSVFERYRSIAKLDDEIINALGKMLDEKRLGFMAAYRISQFKPREILAIIDFLKNITDNKIKGSNINLLYCNSKDCKDNLTEDEIKEVFLSHKTVL